MPRFTKRRSSALVTVTLVVVLVACVSSLVTWSLTRHTSAPATAHTVRTCAGTSLNGYEQHSEAGGSMYVSAIFINSSKKACSLFGYPVITLLNARGPMAHELQRNDSFVPVRRVVVSPEGIAGFVLQYGDGSVAGVDPPQGCRTASQMEVELPHVREFEQPYTTYFTFPLAPCDGGGFSVTALQRGQPQP